MADKVYVNGGGCGCVTLVIAILLFWSIFFGLTVGDKKYNIDVFPPAIKIENIKAVVPQ
jgi:hypothetical protein